MAKLVKIAKPGGGFALGKVNGKLITDEGGAPCCCGEPPPPGECPMFTNVCDGQGAFDLGAHYRVTASGSMDATWFMKAQRFTNPLNGSPLIETSGAVSLSPITVVADIIRCGVNWVVSFGPTTKTNIIGSHETYAWNYPNVRPASPNFVGTINAPKEPGVHDTIPNNGGQVAPPIQCRPRPKWAYVGSGNVNNVLPEAAVFTDENAIVTYMGCLNDLTGGCPIFAGDIYNPPNILPLLSLGAGWAPSAPSFGATPFVSFGTPAFFAGSFSEFAFGIHTVGFTRTASAVTRNYRSRWDRSLSWGITPEQHSTRFEGDWLPTQVSETYEANVSVTWERILPCTAMRGVDLPPGINPETMQPYTQPGRCAGCGQ